MKSYYKERAPVYDRVYKYPERQADLRFLEKHIPKQFAGLDVLEIAAGTGYWTQFISTKAHSVLSTDVAKETLDELINKKLSATVRVCEADAYSLKSLPNNFTGAFAGLWFSHIPIQRRTEFLTGLHKKLVAGSTVQFLDNSVAQCDRLPLSHSDEFGNTYQNRVLDNGVNYEVVKNFPAEQELLKLTSDIAFDQEFRKLENYWLFQYKTK